MEDKKTNIPVNEENAAAEKIPAELNLDELDRYSGGSIKNARKEKRKEMDNDISDRA